MEENDKMEALILQEIREIKKKQEQHREEFLKEITRINTERKIVAGVWGGLFGFISAGILILIKMLIETIYKP